MLSRTYEIKTAPEPAMDWKTYSALVSKEFHELLSREPTEERYFQAFFERHPCCLPEASGVFETGGHGPFPGAIISQPVLPGYAQKIPDFLSIIRDSATVYAVLMEIERPSKRWATESGQSTAEFTQATNQIADWKSWFNNPINISKFLELYRIPREWSHNRSFEQRYLLVYGRRNDQTLTEEFNRKRRQLERPFEQYMTYDRLGPNEKLSQCLCVKVDERGYRAISIPPTLELGPMLDHGNEMIRDKVDAVKSNLYLSDRRKGFLIERIPYWDNWPRNGWRNVDDRE